MSHTSVNKPWYKNWWGIILALLIWPFFLLGLIWLKSEKGLAFKFRGTAGVIILGIVEIFALAAIMPTPPAPTISVQPKPNVIAKSTTQAKPAIVVVPKVKLIGIGETDAVWEASHTADGSFRTRTAYNNNPSDIFGDASNSKNNDKYVATVHQNGIITDYTMSFRQGVNSTKASSVAFTEMPTDYLVTKSYEDQQHGCSFILVHSDLLSTDLTSSFPSNRGNVIIELDTVNNNNSLYSASNVTALNIRLDHEITPSCVM